MSPAPGGPRPVLFSDHGCPFAHRVLALLDHLGVEVEEHVAPPHQRPEGLARWSPSGRVPFLVHGELAIGESTVMLEHLAEAHGLAPLWPPTLVGRTLVRHAFATADAVLAPAVLRDPPRPDRLAEGLDAIGAVVRDTVPGPSLLAFHLAPLWLRARWWRPAGAAARAIADRPALAAWLDGAAALPSVARTARGQELRHG